LPVAKESPKATAGGQQFLRQTSSNILCLKRVEIGEKFSKTFCLWLATGRFYYEDSKLDDSWREHNVKTHALSITEEHAETLRLLLVSKPQLFLCEITFDLAIKCWVLYIESVVNRCMRYRLHLTRQAVQVVPQQLDPAKRFKRISWHCEC